MIDINLAAARLACFASLLLTAGMVLHSRFDGIPRLSPGRRGAVVALSLLALPLSAWWALASVSAMAALPIADLDSATLIAVLKATPLGAVLTVRAATLGALVLLALARAPTLALALPALGTLLSCAWTGHASAGTAGAGRVLWISDMLHLCGAAIWLGALVSFCIEAARLYASPRKPTRDEDRKRALTSLARFAHIGTAIVAVLFATGLLNTVLIALPGGWPSGPWLWLIATKIVLFLAMLLLAANNRWHLVPALEKDVPGSHARLLCSLLLETGAGFAIVLAVALAGTLNPQGM